MNISTLNFYDSKSQNKSKKSSNVVFKSVDEFSRVSFNKHMDGKQLYICSRLNRDEQLWDSVLEYLIQKHPKGIKIFCHAAADGSDSYTAIMRLTEKLGNPQASKYFPIYTSDISNKSINRIKSRVINISEVEIKSVKKTFNQGTISQFFEEQDDKWVVKDDLFSKIRVKRANIINEVDKYKKYSEPIVVIFKNAWYQIKAESRKLLVEKLYNNIKPGSSIVVSDLDIPLIRPQLKEIGFVEIKLPNMEWSSIFEKPMVDKRI